MSDKPRDGRCERCDRRAPLRKIETTRGEKQHGWLCANCVKIVIRPGTNYQVKK